MIYHITSSSSSQNIRFHLHFNFNHWGNLTQRTLSTPFIDFNIQKQPGVFIFFYFFFCISRREDFLFTLLKKTYPSIASNQFNSSLEGVLQALSDPFDFTYPIPRYKWIDSGNFRQNQSKRSQTINETRGHRHHRLWKMLYYQLY
jgi:hypothetical protein